MACWRHPPLTAFLVAFLLQRILLSAATKWVISDAESRITVHARGTDVVQDKYFIPTVAVMGAFVLLSLVCVYFLGCCCNSKRMDRYYSRTAVPPRPTSNPRPPRINLNSMDGRDKYPNVPPSKETVSKAPSSTHASSAPGSPELTSTSLYLPTTAQHPAVPNWQHGNNGSQGAPVSHGFQPIHPIPGPPTGPPTGPHPATMSVRHINPSVTMYPTRGQPLIMTAPHMQMQTKARPEVRHMSSMSSAASSTQIGDPPYVYSPHGGNTLSYASSGATSGVWDNSAMPAMPAVLGSQQEGNSSRKGQQQSPPADVGPPEYIDEGRDIRPDKK